MQSLAEIRSLISRHTTSGEVVTPMPGVRLLSANAPTEPINAVYEPTFALVAQGEKRTILGDRVFDYGPGKYLVVSVELPIVGQVTRASSDEPYLAFGLILRPAAIATLLLETVTIDRDGAEPTGMAVSQTTPDLLDPITRMLRLPERPEDIPVLGPMIEREILWRLVNGEQGATVRQIGLADSRLAQIGRAIRWIRAHYAEIFRIEDLARVAGMSASSFHRHFRAVTTMSPIQYQKQIRLLEARARLMAEPLDVAAIGFEVGYDSPSQFSREYRRLFGAPPGKDASRLQTVSALARDLA